MDIKRVPDFDKISFCYDFLKKVVFGNKIDEAQKYFLPMIPKGASVLIIGGGTGKLLMDIIQTQNPGNIIYLELSTKMLEAAKRRLRRYQNKNSSSQLEIAFRLGSVEVLNPEEKFDVVFTPFVLDVVEEVYLFDLMQQIDFCLHSSGLWFFSDFKNPDSGKRSFKIQKLLLKGMLIFFKMTTGLQLKRLHDFDACFSELGYKAIHSKLFDTGFIQSQVLVKRER